ncbi:MAG TPA: ZIP family metal transporter [Bryobacteraceae bacterium]|nr:ZIP family metal transporter [Bryobacteraceae bacterium]
MYLASASLTGISVPVLATVIGLAGAALGVGIASLRRRTRFAVPFSAGVLLGVVIFGLLPELQEASGPLAGVLLPLAGYGLLLAINRFVYPVCPTCAHDHDHGACADELHGFALPLIAAAAVHSFMDGWSVAASQVAAPAGLRLAVPLAICLHKLPEGVALGGILRASVRSRAVALAWCTLAEGTTLVGGAAGLWMAPYLGTKWTAVPLGLAAGWLIYLGYHAVHEEWKQRGARSAFLSAAAGAAAAAILQRGAGMWFR